MQTHRSSTNVSVAFVLSKPSSG